jgi:hypothetical protein
MDSTNLLIVAITVLGAIVLYGFFKTKTAGWGKYTASTLIMLLALFLSVLLLANNLIDSQIFANVLMAIVGFAGGLAVAKE